MNSCNDPKQGDDVRILLIANQRNAQTVDALFQIITFCDMQGIEHVGIDVSQLPDSAFVYGGEPIASVHPDLEAGVDLIVALGGDGTLLHSARLAAMLDAPITGINFGHLGFLTNTATTGVIPLLADILSDDVVREQRVSLHVKLECQNDEFDAAQGISHQREFFAMNEVAVARGALGRIVDFSYSIAGDHIARMRGDGLIVATATGSTAYSLSAGGPLVGPGYRGMIVVPLAPHTLNSRAIVTERNDIVEVCLAEKKSDGSEVSLFIDGDAIELSSEIVNVTVEVADKPVTVLRCQADGFYKQVSRTFFDGE